MATGPEVAGGGGTEGVRRGGVEGAEGMGRGRASSSGGGAEGAGSARGTGGAGGGQVSGAGRKRDECPSRRRWGLHPQRYHGCRRWDGVTWKEKEEEEGLG